MVFLMMISILVFVVFKYVVGPYFKLSRMKKAIEGKYKFDLYPFRPLGFSIVQRLVGDL
jgi:hypothetical protein